MKESFFTLIHDVAAQNGLKETIDTEKQQASIYISDLKILFTYCETIDAFSMQVPLSISVKKHEEKIYETLLAFNYAYQAPWNLIFALSDSEDMTQKITLQKHISFDDISADELTICIQTLMDIICNQLSYIEKTIMDVMHQKDIQTETGNNSEYFMMHMTKI